MDQSISVWEVLRPNFHIGWNLFLAFVPLILSVLLFRDRGRGLFWWLGVGVFLAFLPNAPYTLTDIIHFIAKIRVEPPLPIWAIVLLMLEFGLYFLAGFQAYVLSLLNLNDYLQRVGARNWILPLELLVNMLCAIGIYLGRFQRLNSWNIVTKPEKLFHQLVEDYTNRLPLYVTAIIFVVITVLYYIVKNINLLLIQSRRRKAL